MPRRIKSRKVKTRKKLSTAQLRQHVKNHLLFLGTAPTVPRTKARKKLSNLLTRLDAALAKERN
jgi:hypothetical protein